MTYFSGESLARLACDWESGLKKARRKHYPPERDIRDWARRLEAGRMGLGQLRGDGVVFQQSAHAAGTMA